MNENLALRLKSLDISNNEIKGLPSELQALVILKTLKASSCSIQRIPNMTGFERLEKFLIDHNDLEMNTIGPLPQSLQSLNISFNHLNTFPLNCHNLINLVELDLTSNRLSTTSGMETLINLSTLILDENMIVEIGIDLGNLTKLQYLSIKTNKLSLKGRTKDNQCIPAEVFQKTSLIHINLAGNNLLKADVMSFIGVDEFLQRRLRNKDKNLFGGAMVDHSLFGLE